MNQPPDKSLTQNYYKVSMTDVRVVVKIGILDWERHPDKKQLLIVDVDLFQCPAEPFKGKKIEDCINYVPVFDYITNEWPNRPHTDLLEMLLEDLAAFCFKQPKVTACRVRIQKPHVLDGQVLPAIEFYRQKP